MLFFLIDIEQCKCSHLNAFNYFKSNLIDSEHYECRCFIIILALYVSQYSFIGLNVHCPVKIKVITIQNANLVWERKVNITYNNFFNGICTTDMWTSANANPFDQQKHFHHHKEAQS